MDLFVTLAGFLPGAGVALGVADLAIWVISQNVSAPPPPAWQCTVSTNTYDVVGSIHSELNRLQELLASVDEELSRALSQIDLGVGTSTHRVS